MASSSVFHEVFEFIEYLFGYYSVPLEPDGSQPVPNVKIAAKAVEELIPVYSSEGKSQNPVSYSNFLNYNPRM